MSIEDRFCYWLSIVCGGGCTVDYALSQPGITQQFVDALVNKGKCRYKDLDGTPHIEAV